MLNSTLDRQAIKKFFHWWKKELSFLVPTALRQLFNESTEMVVIQVKTDKIYFNTINPAQKQPLASLTLNEQGFMDYQSLKLTYPTLDKAKFILRLNLNEAIVKTLTLPKAIEENLSQVISYELDRYTPFNQQQVYFAIKKIATEADKIQLKIIITPKSKLEHAYEILQEWGITPWLVDYEGMANHLADDYQYYNLLPTEKSYKPNKKAQIIQSSLLLLLFLLINCVLILPVWLQYQSGQLLADRIKPIREKALVVQELQHKMAILSEKTNWLIAQKQQSPSLIKILETVSLLLKDDTWLTLIDYKNQKLHLTGESPAASTLIKVLESSPLFSNADFESTVTKNKATGLERFRIMVAVNSGDSTATDEQ
jgi:general secretion pathway protein L